MTLWHRPIRLQRAVQLAQHLIDSGPPPARASRSGGLAQSAADWSVSSRHAKRGNDTFAGVLSCPSRSSWLCNRCSLAGTRCLSSAGLRPAYGQNGLPLNLDMRGASWLSECAIAVVRMMLRPWRRGFFMRGPPFAPSGEGDRNPTLKWRALRLYAGGVIDLLTMGLPKLQMSSNRIVRLCPLKT
jgi:hypothetical protein